jgi:NADH-quinone oxidoreductase subunit L
MFALLIVVPLVVAAFAALLMGDRAKYARYIALAASILSLAMVLIVNSEPLKSQSATWFSLLGYTFDITVSTAPLNMLLLFIVAIMTPIVIAYSIGFMDVPSEQGRYYFEMCIFVASMMLFSIAGDFITMLIGWELLGVTSYLLIGFWYRKGRPPAAARKAVTTVLIGDVLMLVAMLLIWDLYHTFSFISILQAPINPSMWIPMLLILIAAFTKSAQFPFHEWLPDAMEGPAPVSAFLHSSTMVKAGVFLVAMLLPLFSAYHLLNILLVVGIITAVLGATNAMAETNIKRILAYSTMEDLGLIFVALGLNAMTAAMLLFLIPTFSKALLHLAAGSIIKANDDKEQIYEISSVPSGSTLLVAILIGAISIAGVFPLSGFFGKFGVEASATNTLVYAVLVAIGFVSSLYIFRWLFVPLRKASAPSPETRTGFRFIPRSMLLPTYMTAVLVGLSSAAYVFLPSYLAQYNATPIPLAPSGAAIETAVVLLGLALAYAVYFRRSSGDPVSPHGLAHSALYNNVFVNAFYALVARLFGIASSIIDTVDYELYRFIKNLAGSLLGLAGLLRRVENGEINFYIIAFVAGIIAIIIILTL